MANERGTVEGLLRKLAGRLRAIADHLDPLGADRAQAAFAKCPSDKAPVLAPDLVDEMLSRIEDVRYRAEESQAELRFDVTALEALRLYWENIQVQNSGGKLGVDPDVGV